MSSRTFFTFDLKTSIASVNINDWQEVVRDRNIYLSINYLTALEQSMASKMDFLYTIIYDKTGKPVLVGVFQLVTFLYKKKEDHSRFLKHFSTDSDGNLSMNMLVCGNVFADGENGFLNTDAVSTAEAIDQIVSVTKKIKKDENTGKKISVILFKEFWPDSTKYSDLLKEHKFKDFMIDVNMVLPIHPQWKSMEEYLFSMKTKFRTKAKAVFRRSNMLELRSLDHREILQREKRIKELFQNVAEKHSYSYGFIDPLAFAAFKEKLGDAFCFKGVFNENVLIGFSTAFFHKGLMEANYVGLDYSVNQKLAVYQRLLYDYVDQAIHKQVSELQFGRTSELMKSSLGAEPIDMTLYAQHKSAIPNIFVASILNLVSPSDFELRQPFKSKFLEEWTR